MNRDHLEMRAQRIQKLCNDQIDKDLPTWGFREYRARAEMIAEDIIPRGWDWKVIEVIGGGAPRIVLMQFDPRQSGE